MISSYTVAVVPALVGGCDQVLALAALHPKTERRIRGWLGPQTMLEKRKKTSGRNKTTIPQVFQPST